MGFKKLSKDELEKFKLEEAYELHSQLFSVVLSLPGIRNYEFDTNNEDKRYLTGTVWTFPFEYQLDLLRLVIDNKILPHARNDYIEKVETLLDELRQRGDDKYEKNYKVG